MPSMIMKNSKIKEVCKDKNKIKRSVKQIKKGNLTDKQNSKVKEVADNEMLSMIMKNSKIKEVCKDKNKIKRSVKQNSMIKEVAGNAIDIKNNEKVREKIEVKTNVKQAKRANLTNKQNSKIKEVPGVIRILCGNNKVKTNVKQAKRDYLTNAFYAKDMNKRKRRHSHKKSDNITTVRTRRILNEKPQKATSCMKKLYDYSNLCELIASDIKNTLSRLESALITVTNGEKLEKFATMSQ